MAGSTTNTTRIYSSMETLLARIEGSRYPWYQVMPFDASVEPTESNQSNTYNSSIMCDPRGHPLLDDFLDPGFFVKMPYRNKIQVEIKINSITKGTLHAPDFEER